MFQIQVEDYDGKRGAEIRQISTTHKDKRVTVRGMVLCKEIEHPPHISVQLLVHDRQGILLEVVSETGSISSVNLKQSKGRGFQLSVQDHDFDYSITIRLLIID